MKLVFNLNEVAAALGQSPEEFRNIRAKLETVGFPKPVRGLDDRWAIMDVINWVNNESAGTGGGTTQSASHADLKIPTRKTLQQ